MGTMVKKIDGRNVIINEFQGSIIETLKATRKGGFARILAYSPDAKNKRYIERPLYDVTVITRFSVSRMYARILEALEAMRFDDIVINDEKLITLSNEKLQELFNERKEFLIKRYNGERKNAHTEAHARNYVRICTGVVGHLVTAYDKEAKKMLPVLDDNGNATLRSIMLEGLAVNKTMLAKGTAKPVNSRMPTRMGKAIEKALPRVSSAYRRFSLSLETVGAVSIDNNTVLPTELADVAA